MRVKRILQKIFPYIVAIVAMIVIASIYFSPAWQGKTLSAHDVVKGYGSTIELPQYRIFEEKKILWTNRVFSGMPEYVGANYNGTVIFSRIYNFPFSILKLPREVGFLFWYMLGFFLLLVSLRINIWLSLLGAITFCFCTYNLLIIDAGHFMKVRTISVIPPTLGGILLCFRGKFLWGFFLIAFFVGMQIYQGHFQMTYYFILGVICIYIVELIYHIQQKKIKRFIKVSCILLLAGLFGLSPNFARIANLYKYNKHSIRGKSEISIGKKETIKTKNGLDKDYINSWSSEKNESLMLLIPNVKGGKTGYIKNNKTLLDKAPAKYRNFIGNMNQYWGNQPFTSGPFYIGSIVVFLFLLGLFVIKGKFKQWTLAFVLLCLMLSWGGNFSWFTDLFIDYMPLYNKFRAPISILAISAIFIILFVIYFLQQVIQSTDILLLKKHKIPLFKHPQPIYLVIGGCVLGILLLILLFPHVINEFISITERKQLSAIATKNNAHRQVNDMLTALTDLRVKAFRADIWRTFIFIALSILLLHLYIKKKIKTYVFIAFISALIIFDSWFVDKRYINDKHFKKSRGYREEYKLSNIDKQIYQFEAGENKKIINELKSPATIQKLKNIANNNSVRLKNLNEQIQGHVISKYAHYRVFNHANNPFNENKTSYAHPSIGGYNAYKLRRYQDIIEHHIAKGNRQVLNMLNTKYIITKNGLQRNMAALGAAWFVNSIYWANNPNEEILALHKIDTKSTIVVHTRDKKLADDFAPPTKDDVIQMVERMPNRTIYDVHVNRKRLAVFSEIYYPEWELYIDDKKAPYFRANYILRAAVIPTGKHKVEFIFKPKFYNKSNLFSQAASYLYIAVFIGAIGWSIFRFISNKVYP